MAKRMTKAQREERDRAALRRRILDIASGACGRDMDTEDDFVTLKDASRLLPVLKSTFNLVDDLDANAYRGYMVSLHNLEHYETVDSITEFYWDAGIRA